jgi:RNA polymerase sigma factor (TIGR02999 family)
MSSLPHAITQLLIDWGNGDRAALDRLIPLVEGELHRLARRYMQRERPGHLLQTTALVNEAYLRLVDQSRVQWQNRAHFFAVAAGVMRRILLDHARAQHRLKRGGDLSRLDLDAAATLASAEAAEMIALDEALDRLGDLDERKGRIVELRYFGGLSGEEIAHVLGVSPVTVARDWDFARAWLRREMQA